MATIEERVARLELLLSSLDDAGDVPIPVTDLLPLANGGTGATGAAGARTNLGTNVQTFISLNQLDLSPLTATEIDIIEAMPDGSHLAIDCVKHVMPMLTLWQFSGIHTYGALSIEKINANRVYLRWAHTQLTTESWAVYEAQYRNVDAQKLSNWVRTYPVQDMNLETFSSPSEFGVAYHADLTWSEIWLGMPDNSILMGAIDSTNHTSLVPVSAWGQYHYTLFRTNLYRGSLKIMTTSPVDRVNYSYEIAMGSTGPSVWPPAQTYPEA